MSEPNGGWVYRSRIEARGTLLAHLVARHRHSDAATWARRIADGELRLDGETVTTDVALRPGQRLEWHRPPWVEPAVPLCFALLACDHDVLAVAKPAGLPSAPAGGFLEHTLLARVRRRFPEATPLHRLGRGTSGVVLFARSERARRSLAAAWRAGAVERTYRGLARGRLGAEEIAIDVPIGRVPHPLLGTLWGASAGGGRALTWVRGLVTRGPGVDDGGLASASRRPDDGGRLTSAALAGETTVVAIRLGTGRPHQIRIHLAAIGHPLVGDPLYGPAGDAAALPGAGGYRLHATAIEFPHPASGARVAVRCGPPPVLRTA